ncbi:hypothetical protein ZWY2020_024691 [Hordeum vulgare]|nr:hypothetical protein ZWY2020_024691 [Hordeum vulgare]
MEGKEEDVRLGANRYSERQPIGTAAQGGGADEKDYKEPPPAPLFEAEELTSWSFYRAGIAEFLATFLFLYISVLTVMGVVGNPSGSKCGTVGIQGIAWSFGGMIFVLVYCTAGISGGHINPAVTFGLFLARKLSLTRAVFYMVMQCLGAICGAGVVKGFQTTLYMGNGGGANSVAPGYTKGDGLGAEIGDLCARVHRLLRHRRQAQRQRLPRPHFGAAADRVRGVPGAPGDNPHHRHRHQPGALPRRRHHLQQEAVVGRPLDLLVGLFTGAALAAIYHVVVIRAIPFKSRD